MQETEMSVTHIMTMDIDINTKRENNIYLYNYKDCK